MAAPKLSKAQLDRIESEAETIFDQNFVKFKGEYYISQADFMQIYMEACERYEILITHLGKTINIE